MANLAKTTFTGSEGVVFPVGPQASRPGSPSVGGLRFNSTNNTFEAYNGSAWKQTTRITATGGETLVRADGYIEHWFRDNGTFTVQGGEQDIEVLCIGGGGGGSGGAPNAGSPGGAGGGTVYGGVSAVAGSYAVTVGSGGARGFDTGANGDPGGQGGNSSITINGVAFVGPGGPGGTAGTGSGGAPAVPGISGTINSGTSYSYPGVSSVFGTGGSGGSAGTATSNAGAGGTGSNNAPAGGGGSSNNGAAGNGGNSTLHPLYGYGGGGGSGGRDGDGGDLAMSTPGTGLYNGGRGGNPVNSALPGQGRYPAPKGGVQGQDGAARRNAGGGAGLYGAGGGAAADTSNSNSASGGEGAQGVVVIRYKMPPYELDNGCVFYIDPLHEYCINYNRSSTINDLKGNNNATAQGGINNTWAPGSFVFDSTNDWIQADGVATDGTFESGNSFTISQWLLPTLDGYDGGPGGRVIWSTHTSDNGNLHMMFVGPTGQIGHVDNGEVTSNNEAGRVGTQYGWKLFTFAHNGTSYRTYLNGVDVGGATNTKTGNSRFSIGQEYDGATPGDFYLGQQGFTCVHNRLLSTEEINLMFNTTRARYGV